MRKTVALHNLGCKVNACELDEIAGDLLRLGYEIVPFQETADVYIVNTCTVTNIADRKSRQMLHRAKKQNPRALVVAIGCYVDADPQGVKKDDCVDVALGNRDKARVAEVLRDYEESEGETSGRALCDEKENADLRYRSRTRAYIKIQDGCNLFCSYCVIPYARGRSVSRPKEEILEEARALASGGAQEIVLTGIHISSYGAEYAKEDPARAKGALAELTLEMNAIDGVRRIRLGSLEPRTIDEKTIEAFLRAEKLCPHFHLSLQSGSDAVLQRMRRRYTTDDFANVVSLLRKAYHAPAITTDLIAGFPGETQEEFEDGLRFVEEMDFYETHVFPFSARKQTPAAKAPRQLTAAEKARRVDLLIAASQIHARRYREQFLHTPVDVLWEERTRLNGQDYAVGHTERYVRVAKPSANAEVNCGIMGITTLTPTRFLTEDVLA